MLGHRSPAITGNAFPDGVALVQLAPIGGCQNVPSADQWFTEGVRRPDLIDPLLGIKASIENGGRGTFQASNKASEHNILNSTPRIVVAWVASRPQLASEMWMKLTSAPIPQGAQSG